MDRETVHARRWYILGVLVLSLLVVVLDNTVLNVALKTIADPVAGLGATQSQLQWAINAYTLVFAGLLFTWGTSGDRYGRKRVLMTGFVLFGLASLASAYARTPGELIAARALMGIGGAAVLPSTLSIISNVFEPRERPRAIGIWAGAVGLAIAIGPITGGLLLAHFWWGSVFLINVPIVLLGLVAIAWVVPESRDPRPGRFDPAGVALQITGLFGVVYGIIRAGDLGTFAEGWVWVSLLGGLALLLAFGWYERRSDHPALDVRLFRDARFSAAVAAVGLTFFALMGVTFFMVFYLQVVRGYSPLHSGVLLLPLAVAQLLTAPRSPALVRRFGAKVVCAGGLLLVTVAFLSFLTLGVDSNIWVLEALFFVQGAGMGNVMAPATESIMSALPRERAGAGAAVNNTVRQVGAAFGVAVLGTVLSTSYRDRIEPALAGLPLPPQVGDAAAVRTSMAKSVEATYAVIERVGGPLQMLRAPANEAFVQAMHVTAGYAAAVAFAGVLVVAAFLPGHRSPAPVGDDERLATGA